MVPKFLFCSLGKIETLQSTCVGHLELILDDRDVYYIKVCSTPSGLLCGDLPPSRLLRPQSHSPYLIVDITFCVLVGFPLPPTITCVTSWCSETYKEEKHGLETYYHLGQKLIMLGMQEHVRKSVEEGKLKHGTP